MRRAAAVATSLGLGGCLVVNGAFHPGEGEGEGSTGTAVVTGETTSAETTSAETTSAETTTGLTTEGASSTGPGACAGEEGDLCTPQQIVGGKTHLICERVGTWEQARAACEARCARLAVLDEAESAAIFAALRTLMTAEDMTQEQSGEESSTMSRASWWIGGHKVDGGYQWLDGTPMPPNGTGGWNSGDPNQDGPDGCVVLGVFGKGDANGKWFDRNCVDVPYRSICEPL